MLPLFKLSKKHEIYSYPLLSLIIYSQYMNQTKPDMLSDSERDVISLCRIMSLDYTNKAVCVNDRFMIVGLLVLMTWV